MSQALYEVSCGRAKHQIQIIGQRVFLLNHDFVYDNVNPEDFVSSDEAMVLKAIESLPYDERLQAAQMLVESMDADSINCYLIGACIEAYGPNLFGFQSDKVRRIC
jgi:hypothetical protein